MEGRGGTAPAKRENNPNGTGENADGNGLVSASERETITMVY